MQFLVLKYVGGEKKMMMLAAIDVLLIYSELLVS